MATRDEWYCIGNSIEWVIVMVNFSKRRRSISTTTELVLSIVFILLGMALGFGILYGWSLLVIWALNTLFSLGLEYSFSTVGAVLIINMLLGGIFSRK